MTCYFCSEETPEDLLEVPSDINVARMELRVGTKLYCLCAVLGSVLDYSQKTNYDVTSHRDCMEDGGSYPRLTVRLRFHTRPVVPRVPVEPEVPEAVW